MRDPVDGHLARVGAATPVHFELIDHIDLSKKHGISIGLVFNLVRNCWFELKFSNQVAGAGLTYKTTCN